ncbi:MAG: LysR family transcriptional regulator [Myxococcales bacterium]|nr:LysR family transcriptional regulator [Myxococcales bacterium]
MELCQLRAFIAVMDRGSFAAAAATLQVSHATLRARVTALEEALGGKLLVRGHRGAAPTERGQHFVESARALLHEADALIDSAQRWKDELAGELRVLVPVGLPPGPGALLVSEMRRLFPKLRVRIDFSHAPATRPPPDVDLIIHNGPDIPGGAYRTFTMTRFTVGLLASPAYLAAHGRPETPEDLSEHTLLAWRLWGEDRDGWPLRDGGLLQVQPAFVSNHGQLIQTLANAGQGIALMPYSELVQAIFPDIKLEPVLPEQVGHEIALRMFIPEAKSGTPRGRAAIRVHRELTHRFLGKIPEPD